MNRGVLDGVTDAGWKYYKPDVIGVAGVAGNPDDTGAGTDTPRFDPTYPQYQRGRYILDDGLIRGWVQLGFVGTFYAGLSSWLIKLPRPAVRWHETLPIVIGPAICYWSFTDPNKNIPGIAIVADSAWKIPWTGATATTSVTDPENYFQIQFPYALRHGTGTFGTTSSGAITHNLDLRGASVTMSPADVDFVFVEASGTNNCEPPYLFSNAETTMEVRTQQSVGGGTPDFAWKIRQHTLQRRQHLGNDAFTSTSVPTSISMLGSRFPFDFSELTALAPFGNVFVSFRYAPAD